MHKSKLVTTYLPPPFDLHRSRKSKEPRCHQQHHTEAAMFHKGSNPNITKKPIIAHKKPRLKYHKNTVLLVQPTKKCNFTQISNL
jgi:hypothetical protein